MLGVPNNASQLSCLILTVQLKRFKIAAWHVFGFQLIYDDNQFV